MFDPQLKKIIAFSVKRQISIKLFYLYQRLQCRDKYFFKIKFVFFLYLRLSALSKENDLPLCIYFWYQTDSGVPNTSIYSAVCPMLSVWIVQCCQCLNCPMLSVSELSNVCELSNVVSVWIVQCCQCLNYPMLVWIVQCCQCLNCPMLSVSEFSNVVSVWIVQCFQCANCPMLSVSELSNVVCLNCPMLSVYELSNVVSVWIVQCCQCMNCPMLSVSELSNVVSVWIVHSWFPLVFSNFFYFKFIWH